MLSTHLLGFSNPREKKEKLVKTFCHLFSKSSWNKLTSKEVWLLRRWQFWWILHTASRKFCRHLAVKRSFEWHLKRIDFTKKAECNGFFFLGGGSSSFDICWLFWSCVRKFELFAAFNFFLQRTNQSNSWFWFWKPCRQFCKTFVL